MLKSGPELTQLKNYTLTFAIPQTAAFASTFLQESYPLVRSLAPTSPLTDISAAPAHTVPQANTATHPIHLLPPHPPIPSALCSVTIHSSYLNPSQASILMRSS